MSGTLPTVMTMAGLTPQTPTSLNAQVISNAETLAPGLTADLPGSLIEDMSSTATGSLILIDQARVDLVNSITPYGANPFILNQLGQVYGVPLGLGSNTSVYVVFTGTPGYIVQPGFIVSDGTNPQYVVQDGGIIGSSGVTTPLQAVSNQPGTWAVPANTVTQLITSVPSGITLTVTNPLVGNPSTAAQTEEAYRAQVLESGLATAQGMPTYLRSRLARITGVVPRLVTIRQKGTLWEVICGGAGDPYQIAYAIFRSMDNLAVLTGSVISVTGITNAANALITTDLNHGLTVGQTGVQVNGVVGMTSINAVSLTVVTVPTPTTFTVNFNSTSAGTYVSGGVLTPNTRTVIQTVQDSPDAYVIPFVAPPLQTVSMTLNWATNSVNPISAATVAAAGQTALANYINNIVAGQPINVLEMQTVFQTAVANLIPIEQLIKMVFVVEINGFVADPESATDLIILSDPESYFQINPTQIVITQGS